MTYTINPIIKSQDSYLSNPISYGMFSDTFVIDFNSKVSEMVFKKRKDIFKDYMEPISRQQANPIIKFLELKNQWKEETAMLSSITEISMNPAYQQIIGMGQIAIPLILSELKKKPDHWFWALKSITGEDPVLQEQRGRLKEMAGAWLKWGKGKGYIG